MSDQHLTNSELIIELERLRSRIAELESSLAGKEDQTPDPLIKKEEHDHLLFEANPNPMWVYDLETLAFLEVNSTAIKKYGFTREEFLSMTIADIRPPKDIPRLMGNISCITCGLDEAGLWLHKKKDGTVIDVEIISHTLTYKGRRAELVLARDVTAQVQAEKALRESEERYRTLLETLVHGVQENDCNGVITYSNPAHHRLLGYEDGELVGMAIWDLHTSLEKQRALRDYLAVLIKEQPTPVPYLITVRRKDGSPVDLQIDWDYQRRADGTLKGFVSVITDITDRRKDREALNAAKEYAESLIETSNTIVVGINLGGDITVFNRAAEAITGYSRSELTGRNWFEVLVPEELYPHVWAEFERLMTGGMPEHFENPILTKSGEERTIAWQNNQVYEQGKIAGTISFGIDITERKRMEEALYLKNYVFDISIAANSIADTQGVIIQANHAFLKIWGYSGTEEVIGKKIPDFLQNADETAAILSALNTAEKWEGNYTARKKDGSPFAAFGVATILKDKQGNTIGYQSSVLDVTDHRRADEALRESEEKFRSVFDSASDGIILVDPQTKRFVLGNATFAQMLGIRQDDLPHMKVEDIHPTEALQDVLQAIEKIAPGEKPSKGNVPVLRKDGSIFFADIATSWINLKGTSYMTGFFRDITERKKAEQERLDLERRLLHAQKLESLGILAGGIAHDFNNLLMAILGNLDMALLKLPAGSPAGMNIEQSAQAARRASDLTRQMLAYSGKGRFLVEQTDLNELMEENAGLFSAAIAKTTTLSLHLFRPLLLIEADKGQLQQVIMNLLTNASEAIDEKPGVISLSTGIEDSDARYLAQSRTAVIPPAGRFVYLEVSDTGSGMDEQTQQRLFDPFFTTKTMGRGLGMSAILGIVGGHRGAVFVDSAEGRGTAIRILFPAPAETQPKKETSARETVQETGMSRLSGTILVVDDEEIVRNVCSEMVASFGLQVLTASDGQEALEAFSHNANRISCVILDLTMPKMDGMTAFREIIRISPDAKVILSSGYDEKDSLQRLSGLGLAGFIQKPYTLEKLYSVLVNAMNT